MLDAMSPESSPLEAHSATPSEIRERIAAERDGAPYLVLRDGDGRQRVVALGAARLSVGRGEANDVALTWDQEVSRLHAELELIGGAWTVVDDGLSRNGTFLAGARISGRTRLRDRDVLRFGRTTVAFCDPAGEESRERTVVGEAAVSGEDLSSTQRQVLVALARPFKHGTFASPATNQAIADELHLSVDAVKAQLRVLYGRFGLDALPQNQKRQRLVAEALEHGLLNAREL